MTGPATSAPAPALAALDIAVLFGDRLVVDGVSFSVRAGEVAVVEGRSGSGKSTLLRALSTLEPIARGELLLSGVDSRALAPSAYRTAVAYIPQEPVMFDASVVENVRAGPRLRGKALTASRAAELLEQVGLAPAIAQRSARDLSGGEKQRVAIARALANDPRVLLLDEPTSALDPAAAAGIVELVRATADSGCAVVVVTHAREHALALGGSRYMCQAGKLSEAR